jgi:hypothetical protein
MEPMCGTSYSPTDSMVILNSGRMRERLEEEMKHFPED